MFAKVKPNTRIIGQNIIYFNQVDSTNNFALELMKQDMADDGTVIIAEFQGKGRGQTGKFWVSEPFENLLFSLLLKPVTNVEPDPFILNKAIALSLQQFISHLIPNEEVLIKWPNDILVNRRKICGILVENNYSGQKLNWCIAGIGLNVNQNFEQIDSLKATSLKTWMSGEVQRDKVLSELLETIEKYYLKVLDGKSIDIDQEFNRHLLGYQNKMEFILDNQRFNAKIKACDKDGRLLLELPDGSINAFIHGSIQQVVYE